MQQTPMPHTPMGPQMGSPMSSPQHSGGGQTPLPPHSGQGYPPEAASPFPPHMQGYAHQSPAMAPSPGHMQPGASPVMSPGPGGMFVSPPQQRMMHQAVPIPGTPPAGQMQHLPQGMMMTGPPQQMQQMQMQQHMQGTPQQHQGMQMHPGTPSMIAPPPAYPYPQPQGQQGWPPQQQQMAAMPPSHFVGPPRMMGQQPVQNVMIRRVPYPGYPGGQMAQPPVTPGGPYQQRPPGPGYPQPGMPPQGYGYPQGGPGPSYPMTQPCPPPPNAPQYAVPAQYPRAQQIPVRPAYMTSPQGPMMQPHCGPAPSSSSNGFLSDDFPHHLTLSHSTSSTTTSSITPHDPAASLVGIYDSMPTSIYYEEPSPFSHSYHPSLSPDSMTSLALPPSFDSFSLDCPLGFTIPPSSSLTIMQAEELEDQILAPVAALQVNNGDMVLEGNKTPPVDFPIRPQRPPAVDCHNPENHNPLLSPQPLGPPKKKKKYYPKKKKAVQHSGTMSDGVIPSTTSSSSIAKPLPENAASIIGLKQEKEIPSRGFNPNPLMTVGEYYKKNPPDPLKVHLLPPLISSTTWNAEPSTNNQCLEQPALEEIPFDRPVPTPPAPAIEELRKPPKKPKKKAPRKMVAVKQEIVDPTFDFAHLSASMDDDPDVIVLPTPDALNKMLRNIDIRGMYPGGGHVPPTTPQTPYTPNGPRFAAPPGTPGGSSVSALPAGVLAATDMRSPPLMSPTQGQMMPPTPSGIMTPARQMSNGDMMGMRVPATMPMPHQATAYIARDPNFTIQKPDMCLLGCNFFVLDWDKYSSEKSDQASLTTMIRFLGGDVEFGGAKHYDNRRPWATHVIVSTLLLGVNNIRHIDQITQVGMQAARDMKRVVTMQWLVDCIEKGSMEVPWRHAHLPLLITPETMNANKGRIISVSGFTDSERAAVKYMVDAIGAKLSPGLSDANHLLIAKNENCTKVDRARDWGVPVVNFQWLIDVYCKQTMLDVGHLRYSVKMQSMEVDCTPWMLECTDPAYKNCLGGWRCSLGWTDDQWNAANQFKHEQQHNEAVFPLKKMKMSTSPAPTEEEIASFHESSPPSPSAASVAVVFEGFDDELTQALSRKVRFLGGRVVDSVAECTHLVPLNGKRTLVLLEAIALGRAIVDPKWVIVSYDARTFADTLDFFLRDEETEKMFSCCYRLSVLRARHQKVFEDCEFYISPSVEPSVAAVKKLIEYAGGVVDACPPSPQKMIDCIETEKPYIVIATECDLPFVRYLVDAGITIYNSEMVFTSVMRQEVDPHSAFHINPSAVLAPLPRLAPPSTPALMAPPTPVPGPSPSRTTSATPIAPSPMEFAQPPTPRIKASG